MPVYALVIGRLLKLEVHKEVVKTAFLTGFRAKSYNGTSTTADVAQLVESQIVILVVAGSSPVVRPKVHY